MKTLRLFLLALVLVALCWIPAKSQLPGLTCSGGNLNCTPPLSIALGGTNQTTFGTTNGVDFFNGTALTNGAGLTFDGTLLTVGTATNIKGSATNNSATAGNIGEYVTSQVTSGSAVTVATTSATPITSISLTAGDWDVAGVVDYIPNAATSVTTLAQGSQALNNCMTLGPALGAQDTFTLWETAANIIGASSPAWEIPVTRVSVSATTTVCLIAKATFTINSLTAYGTIRARRMR